VASVRGYLLAGRDEHLEELRRNREDFQRILAALREHVQVTEGRYALEQIARTEEDYRVTSEIVIAAKRGNVPTETVLRKFDEELLPKRTAMNHAIDTFTSWAEHALEQRKLAATAVAASASNLVTAIAALIVVLSATIAFLLTKVLSRQIGVAVGRVQSSSAELQAAASQQAAGAKQQAVAANEISTTITELLATSRQIAESARAVAQIAREASGAIRVGDDTVQKGNDAMDRIRHQVDAIVGQMVELGRKSQQIGIVLDLVLELAEQTNILAVNAMLEAAGTGDAGIRFSVVAEEIRKLADRIGGSAKEIRTLINDVRAAVNTTIMTTETGTKAVEAGTRQFIDVASAFAQISALVATNSDAAREIELSTRQQTSGVEQADFAIESVAQASKEIAVSTQQTLQTASQLSLLSRDLLRFVRKNTAVQPAIG
jgi:hypothetical protein